MPKTVILSLIVYFVACGINMTWRRKFAKITKLSSPVVTTITLGFFVWPLSVIAANALSLHENVTGLTLTFWLCCFIAALTQIGSSAIGFTSLRTTDVANYNLISQIYTPISIGLAFIFLNETLTLPQVIGTLFLLGGTYVILKKKRARFDLSRGNILALCCGLLLGIGTVVARQAIRQGGLEAYIKYGFLMQMSILLLISGKTLVRQWREIKKSWKDLVIMGLGRFGQLFGFLVATVYASNLALVSSVTTFSVVVVFACGYIFLNERQELSKKLAGVLLAVTGLLIVSLT